MKQPETIHRRYPLLSRVSLAMTILSVAYWFISSPFWLPIPLPENFPNCISAKWQSGRCSVGALSHHRLSCLFLSGAVQSFESSSRWSERLDGHFCGFDIPPTEAPHEPPGFILSLNLLTIGWNLPYWVMVAIWSSVYLKTRPENLSILDLLLITSVFAAIFSATVARVGLLLVVPMNLLTVGLVLILAVRGVRLIWSHYPAGQMSLENGG